MPLILSRVRPRDPRSNQAATYFMIEPASGFAAPQWQESVGEVIALRIDGKPFTSAHFYATWDFFSVVLDAYGDASQDEIAGAYFSPAAFRAFHEGRSAPLEW